jgi:hypothetical protein
VFAHDVNGSCMFFANNNSWFIGERDKMEEGKPHGYFCAHSPEIYPQTIAGVWRVWDGQQWVGRPELTIASFSQAEFSRRRALQAGKEARQRARVLAAAVEVVELHGRCQHKAVFLGVYRIQRELFIHGRPVYRHDGSPSFMFYASNGSWFIGERDKMERGKPHGFLCAADSATQPNKIRTTWKEWDGEKWRAVSIVHEPAAVELHCGVYCADHSGVGTGGGVRLSGAGISGGGLGGGGGARGDGGDGGGKEGAGGEGSEEGPALRPFAGVYSRQVEGQQQQQQQQADDQLLSHSSSSSSDEDGSGDEGGSGDQTISDESGGGRDQEDRLARAAAGHRSRYVHVGGKFALQYFKGGLAGGGGDGEGAGAGIEHKPASAVGGYWAVVGVPAAAAQPTRPEPRGDAEVMQAGAGSGASGPVYMWVADSALCPHCVTATWCEVTLEHHGSDGSASDGMSDAAGPPPEGLLGAGGSSVAVLIEPLKQVWQLWESKSIAHKITGAAMEVATAAAEAAAAVAPSISASAFAVAGASVLATTDGKDGAGGAIAADPVVTGDANGPIAATVAAAAATATAAAAAVAAVPVVVPRPRLVLHIGGSHDKLDLFAHYLRRYGCALAYAANAQAKLLGASRLVADCRRELPDADIVGCVCTTDDMAHVQDEVAALLGVQARNDPVSSLSRQHKHFMKLAVRRAQLQLMRENSGAGGAAGAGAGAAGAGAAGASASASASAGASRGSSAGGGDDRTGGSDAAPTPMAPRPVPSFRTGDVEAAVRWVAASPSAAGSEDGAHTDADGNGDGGDNADRNGDGLGGLYPVVVKTPMDDSGQGVMRCADEGEVRAAFRELAAAKQRATGVFLPLDGAGGAGGAGGGGADASMEGEEGVEEHDEADECGWRVTRGFLAAGGCSEGFDSPLETTLSEAKRLCAASLRCRGFTFQLVDDAALEAGAGTAVGSVDSGTGSETAADAGAESTMETGEPVRALPPLLPPPLECEPLPPDAKVRVYLKNQFSWRKDPDPVKEESGEKALAPAVPGAPHSEAAKAAAPTASAAAAAAAAVAAKAAASAGKGSDHDVTALAVPGTRWLSYEKLTRTELCARRRAHADSMVLCVEPFLFGEEYVVNTVSHDGEHLVTDVWLSAPKRLLERRQRLVYDRQDLVRASTVPHVCSFARSVLDAVGFANGASHLELVDSAQYGPALIEVNPRCGQYHRAHGIHHELVMAERERERACLEERARSLAQERERGRERKRGRGLEREGEPRRERGRGGGASSGHEDGLSWAEHDSAEEAGDEEDAGAVGAEMEQVLGHALRRAVVGPEAETIPAASVLEATLSSLPPDQFEQLDLLMQMLEGEGAAGSRERTLPQLAELLSSIRRSASTGDHQSALHQLAALPGLPSLPPVAPPADSPAPVPPGLFEPHGLNQLSLLAASLAAPEQLVQWLRQLSAGARHSLQMGEGGGDASDAVESASEACREEDAPFFMVAVFLQCEVRAVHAAR